MSYVVSKYNFETELNNSKECIIFNTLNGAVVLLNKKEYNKYKAFKQGSLQSNTNYDNFITNGLFVDEKIDELGIVNLKRYQALFNSRSYGYRVLTTTACNARCDYCYEEDVKISTMTKETALQFIKFIKSHAIDPQDIRFTWFGGEPLINHKIISFIMFEAKKSFPNIKITSQLITNGTLFTKEIIDEAKNNWNLELIQVTLDGQKETHEKIKKYVNLMDAFDITIKNIKLLLEAGLKVSLRINFDKNNFEDVKKLIPFIKIKLGQYNNLICYVASVFSNSIDDSFIEKEQLKDYMRELTDVLAKNGFYKKTNILPSKKTKSCYATSPNFFQLRLRANCLNVVWILNVTIIALEIFLMDTK